MGNDGAKRKEHGEVEWGVEAAVYRPICPRVSDAPGEVRGNGGIGVEDFSNGGEVWVKLVEFGVEAMPECPAYVREGIEAQTVEAG